jgi:hypothetical protein
MAVTGGVASLTHSGGAFSLLSRLVTTIAGSTVSVGGGADARPPGLLPGVPRACPQAGSGSMPLACRRTVASLVSGPQHRRGNRAGG